MKTSLDQCSVWETNFLIQAFCNLKLVYYQVRSQSKIKSKKLNSELKGTALKIWNPLSECLLEI